jgi:aldehyde:ferredoxin oxidoreductase
VKGYGGRILFVDAGTGATRVEPLDAATARAYLGGNGLAARLLYDHVPARTDAFAPANAVVFSVGPITDTTVPGNSRACVATKSPLTSSSSTRPSAGASPRRSSALASTRW